MKNKSFALLLTALIVGCSALTFAGCNHNETQPNKGLHYELNTNKDGYIVTNVGTTTDETVTIPSAHDNLPVTSIGNSAFDGCTSLKSLTLPETLTSIGAWAFSGCTSLSSVNIPDGVTAIWEFAFYNCSSLSNVNLPDEVTLIGNNAFNGCTALENIIIPVGVLHIGSGAFNNCPDLTVHCEAESEPSGWNSAWCYKEVAVVWGK